MECQKRKLVLNIIENNPYIDFLIKEGENILSDWQKEIVKECIEKGDGGLDLRMGSGKTRVSLIVGLKQVQMYPGSKLLIIVKKSLIPTWIDELRKCFDDLIKYDIYHYEYIDDIENWVPKTDIIITTPEAISGIYKKNDLADQFVDKNFGMINSYKNINTPMLSSYIGGKYFYSTKWGSIILDEADNYFNPYSRGCQSIASLSSHHRWLLSGTMFSEPKDENLFGYYLLLNDKKFPRNLQDFRRFIGSTNYQGISNTLVKREVNQGFEPPKINKHIVSHTLSEPEALIYMNIKHLFFILSERIKNFKIRRDNANAKKFSTYRMTVISYIRQCLLSPLLPIKSMNQDKNSELTKIFMEHINTMGLSDWLNNEKSLYSSRIEAICSKINNHPNEKIIIFSCYRVFLDALRLFLPKNRQNYTIEGNDKIEKRGRITQEFCDSSNGILLLTYDIGAVGLNLQACSTVFLSDFWWNASKSEQAISRVIRPGQMSNSINLYYFTSNTGMENAIFKLQTDKLSMGNEILNGPIKTNKEKIKIDNIIRLINTKDNITILNNIISK
jgi:SNF2 family DNA or RNA helicase